MNSFQYNTIMYGDITETEGIAYAKDLIGSKDPYVIERRYDGNKVVIFSDHFIEAYRTALSKNCIADMTDKEKDLYFEYINYTEHQPYSNIDMNSEMQFVLAALDQWTMDELLGNEHPDYATCE